MAKQKPGDTVRTQTKPATDDPGAGAYTPPGGEERGVKEEGSNGDVVLSKQAQRGEANQIERALLHLEFFEQELQGLLDKANSAGGPIRRAAARRKMQFRNAMVRDWEPVKLARLILQDAQAEMTTGAGSGKAG